MTRRRLTEAAFLLPWVGAFLLTPPLVVIFQTWSEVTSLPLFIVYVFVCWLALIVLGGLLGSRLHRMEETEHHPEPRMDPREQD